MFWKKTQINRSSKNDKNTLLSNAYVTYPVDNIVHLHKRAQMSIFEREFLPWNLPGL